MRKIIVLFSFLFLYVAQILAQDSTQRWEMNTDFGYFRVKQFAYPWTGGLYSGSEIAYKMSNQIKVYAGISNAQVRVKYRYDPIFRDTSTFSTNYTLFQVKFGREFRYKKWGIEPQMGIFYWRNQFTYPDFDAITSLKDNSITITWLGARTAYLQEAGLSFGNDFRYYFSKKIALALSFSSFYIVDLGFQAYRIGGRIILKI